jgi:hypothetical protein
VGQRAREKFRIGKTVAELLFQRVQIS